MPMKERAARVVDGDACACAVTSISVEGHSVEKATKERCSSKEGEASCDSRLANEVGNGKFNQKEDVVWLKIAMCHLGRYRRRGEPHGYIDRDLHQAIKNYQRDRGLRQDGFLKPLGPTECVIRIELARLDKE